MALKDMRIAFETDGSGDSVDYGEKTINGKLLAVMYDYGDALTGMDVVMTTDRVDVVENFFAKDNMGVADAVFYPRHLVHSNTTGGALTGTAGGDRVLGLLIGRPKITVSNGGSVNTGAFILIYEE